MSTTVEILEAKLLEHATNAMDLHKQARKLEQRGRPVAAEMARVGSKAMRSAALSCTADLLALGAW